MVRSFFAAADVEVRPEAVSFLAANLGGDRELTKRELEKVLLLTVPVPAML